MFITIPSTQQCVRHKVGAQYLFEGWLDEERKKVRREGKGEEEEREGKEGRKGGRKEGREEGRHRGGREDKRKKEGVRICHLNSLLPKGKGVPSRQRKHP